MGPLFWLGVAALGVGVGYVAGMFGIGGGFLMTPLLAVLFNVPLTVAVGTGLCQMIGTALASNLRHRRLRQGERRFDLLMLPGTIIGVELGARAVEALASAGSLRVGAVALPWVNLIIESGYLVVLGGVAVSYWRHGGHGIDTLQYVRPGPLSRLRLGPTVDLPAAGLRGVSGIVIAYIGLGLGFVSGVLGIGGGVALNPILIYGFGFPIRQAVGTGIIVLLVTAVVGTAAHAARGHVHLGLAVVLMVGGTFSAQLGALASKRLSGKALGRIHAIVIAAAMAAIIWDLARRAL